MIPATIVKLLQGVNLSKDYNNTFSWETVDDQTAFFVAKKHIDFTDFTYQREEKAIRIPVNCDLLHDVTYLMFNNSNYSYKWFYAFVDRIEYINTGMSLVYFTIDVWQTYYFDIVWKNCMIVRQHIPVDTIGLSRMDEGLEIGSVHALDYDHVDELQSLCFVIASTCNISGVPVGGYIQTGVYSGVGYFYFTTDGSITGFISALVALSKVDAIKSIFVLPTCLLSGTYSNGDQIQQADEAYTTFSIAKKISGDILGYTPRNNKCYQYPYNYLEVSDNRGGSNQYAWEDWNTNGFTNDASFKVTGNIAPCPTVFLIPQYFKGVLQDTTEMMTISDYPLCTWSYDVFAAWLAQNQVTNALKIGTGALSVVSGVMTKSPMAVASGVMGFAETIGGFYERSLQPNALKGSASGGGNIAAGIHNFRITRKAIARERIEIIDDYFQMYGYKVNHLGTPDIRSRPHWNYLQLSDVNVFGNFPSADLTTIRESLRRGVTFWHNDNIGNYNRTNK